MFFKKMYIFLFFLLCMQNLVATSFSKSSFESLVDKSDVIISGKILKVDMLDYKGRKIYNSSAMIGVTYPHISNILRLHIKIEEKILGEVKENNIIISLQARRLSLGISQEMFSGKLGVFLIKKQEKYTLVSEQYIYNPITDKNRIISHINKKMLLFCKKFDCLM